MFLQHPKRNVLGGKFLLIAGVWLLGVSTAFAQFPSGGGMGGMGHGMGRGMGGRHGSEDKENQSKKAERKPSENSHKDEPLPPHFFLTRHGGQYLTPEWDTYEVVFLPYQTRIYLYDKTVKPLSAKDVRAEMTLQMPNDSNTYRIPFQYVAQPAGSTEQDYVAANFNATELSDQETPVAIEFSNLPDRQHPKSTFTPLVSKSQIRPYVVQVSTTFADREGVARQRICPVSGDPLGSRGPVSKVLIGDYPLYLSNDDCIAAVRANPEKYLPRPPVPNAR
jgi:hypothetical protein